MSAVEYLQCVEVEPPGPAQSAVIWLHGLGADGHDFELRVTQPARRQDQLHGGFNNNLPPYEAGRQDEPQKEG